MIKIGKTTPIEERNEIVKLLKEYRDVLAFSYDELKVYREDVIQHVIPLKEETKPFRQKLRQVKPQVSSFGPTGVTENVRGRNHCPN
jgi:hypothetical protein